MVRVYFRGVDLRANLFGVDPAVEIGWSGEPYLIHL
jgi:hypothetical protein